VRILIDQEIADLISEPKVVPNNWFSRLDAKDKAHYQHKEKEIDVEGSNGNLFRVILNVVKKDCFASLAMTHNDEKTGCHCEERSDVAISRRSLIVNSFMRRKMPVN